MVAQLAELVLGFTYRVRHDDADADAADGGGADHGRGGRDH